MKLKDIEIGQIVRVKTVKDNGYQHYVGRKGRVIATPVNGSGTAILMELETDKNGAARAFLTDVEGLELLESTG